MSEVETNEEREPDDPPNPKIICEKCHLSFTRKSNFYRHMRTIHRKKSLDNDGSKECGSKKCNPEIVCEKCQLSFTRKGNFLRHMRRIHPKEDPDVSGGKESVPELYNPEITCQDCQLSFSRKANFYKHMRKFHHKEDFDFNGGKVCGICKQKLWTLSLLHDHLSAKHNVSLDFTEETFYSEDDFLTWKSEVERIHQSNFIKLRGTRDLKQEGVKAQLFVCHRSGFPEIKKHYPENKSIVSMKIGFTCPASIYMASETVEGITCIKARYQSVHVGHELGLNLRLSKEDKARLVSSLKEGVSTSSLLEELRENYAPSHPYRRVTRRDLHNIILDSKISRTLLWQREDFVTVDILVKKIYDSDFQSSLLVYKPVGESLPEYPALNENDFFLGVMNDVQENLLQMFGKTCIMVDYTDYKNFYLSTVMVRDEDHESLPVATLFSSKISEEILQPFFEAIQLRFPQLRTKFLMTDDVISFYNAWQKVFEDEAQHLLCSWYVLRNLTRSVELKVKNENRREDIKNKLNAILKEEDIATFKFLMMNFIEEHKVDEKDFITYFRTDYEPRAQKWAYCYRIALGLNPDMGLEKWRDELKLDDNGPASKRLEKSLSLVNYTIAKKLISNFIVMDMETLNTRISLCQKLHEESLSEADQYKVVEMDEKRCSFSERENKMTFHFTIEKLTDDCVCDIRCRTCNICLHSMSRTCVDYCVHFAICKHMHRFCMSLEKRSKIVDDKEEDDDVDVRDSQLGWNSDGNGPDASDEPMDIGESSGPASRRLRFAVGDVRARVRRQLRILEKRLEHVESLEVIKNVEVNVNAINSYLDDAIPSQQTRCQRYES